MRIPFLRVATAFALIGGAAVCGAAPGNAVAPTSRPQWTVQFGTTGADSVNSTSSTPSGDVYVGGDTTESLIDGANTAPSVRDAFIAKYDRNGNPKWLRQFGTTAEDSVTDVAVTSRGDLYVVGITDGTLSETNPGGRDGFIAKYDRNGNRKWIRRIGTPGYDEVRSVAVTASGDAYLTGFTSGTLNEAQQGDNDSFVARYDRNGNRKWLHQFGSAQEERGNSIAVAPNGTSYAVGYTYGNPTDDTALGDLEGYLVSFDKNGNRRWIHLISTTGIDEALAVAVSAKGDVYVGGDTTGTLNEAPVGMKDAFIAQYTSAGVLTWVHQDGAIATIIVEDIAATSNGDAFVVGITTGSLNETNLSPGSFDPFITRYTRAGDRAWFRQFGTSSQDLALSVTATPAGDAYVGGYTDGGALTSESPAGGLDGFITKFPARTNSTWTHQVGTSNYDEFNAVASTSSGDIYAIGRTSGVFAAGGGGGSDVFLAKYDKNGNQKWIKQFGTAASDTGTAIAVNARGDVYIGGNTYGAIAPDGGSSGDAFVAKCDKNGNECWIKQFGSSDSDDGVSGLAVDAQSNVYLTGYTYGSMNGTNQGNQDGFVTKFDKNGNQKWVRQFGTAADDTPASIAVTAAGDAYIGGDTLGLFATTDGADQDAFLMKYDRNGNQKWIKQFGSAGSDQVRAVAIGRGNTVMLTGITNGPLTPSPAGNLDAFLAKYDKNGNRVWLTQFGTVSVDQMLSIAVASNGDSYLGGSTTGTFPGEVQSGSYDALVARFDKNGDPVWVHQFGSTGVDQIFGITFTAKGGITVIGTTNGRLNEPFVGVMDGFIAHPVY